MREHAQRADSGRNEECRTEIQSGSNQALEACDTAQEQSDFELLQLEETQQRRETNAALAALAKAGNTYALGQLWETNRPLLRKLFWRWYVGKEESVTAHGMTVEDFEQEGYFAVKAAAEWFEPAKGTFSTALQYAVRQTMRRVMCGEHGKLVKVDGKDVRVSANPLNGSTSLDAPIQSGEDTAETTKGDLLPDNSAALAFENVIEDAYTEQLHEALDDCLNSIDERRARVIRGRFYDGKTLQDLSQEIGVNAEFVRQLQNKGLIDLRRGQNMRRLAQFREEIISTHAYSGTGFGAWKYRGSVEECTVEELERLGIYRRMQ